MHGNVPGSDPREAVYITNMSELWGLLQDRNHQTTFNALGTIYDKMKVVKITDRFEWVDSGRLNSGAPYENDLDHSAVHIRGFYETRPVQCYKFYDPDAQGRLLFSNAAQGRGAKEEALKVANVIKKTMKPGTYIWSSMRPKYNTVDQNVLATTGVQAVDAPWMDISDVIANSDHIPPAINGIPHVFFGGTYSNADASARRPSVARYSSYLLAFKWRRNDQGYFRKEEETDTGHFDPDLIDSSHDTLPISQLDITQETLE